MHIVMYDLTKQGAAIKEGAAASKRAIKMNKWQQK